MTNSHITPFIHINWVSLTHWLIIAKQKQMEFTSLTMRSGGLIVWIHCLFVIYLVLAAIICCQVLHSHVNGNDVQIEVLYQHCDKSLPKGGILDATYLHENVKSVNPLPPPWISIGTFAFYFMKHSVSFCHGAATFSLWQAATTTLTVAIVLGCSVLLSFGHHSRRLFQNAIEAY